MKIQKDELLLRKHKAFSHAAILRWFFDNSKKEEKVKDRIVNDGILYCSGMIAGEGLTGIVLALCAVLGVDKVIDLSGMLNLSPMASTIGSVVVFALMILCMLKFTDWKKQDLK